MNSHQSEAPVNEGLNMGCSLELERFADQPLGTTNSSSSMPDALEFIFNMPELSNLDMQVPEGQMDQFLSLDKDDAVSPVSHASLASPAASSPRVKRRIENQSFVDPTPPSCPNAYPDPSNEADADLDIEGQGNFNPVPATSATMTPNQQTAFECEIELETEPLVSDEVEQFLRSHQQQFPETSATMTPNHQPALDCEMELGTEPQACTEVEQFLQSQQQQIPATSAAMHSSPQPALDCGIELDTEPQVSDEVEQFFQSQQQQVPATSAIMTPNQQTALGCEIELDTEPQVSDEVEQFLQSQPQQVPATSATIHLSPQPALACEMELETEPQVANEVEQFLQSQQPQAPATSAIMHPSLQPALGCEIELDAEPQGPNEIEQFFQSQQQQTLQTCPQELNGLQNNFQEQLHPLQTNGPDSVCLVYDPQNHLQNGIQVHQGAQKLVSLGPNAQNAETTLPYPPELINYQINPQVQMDAYTQALGGVTFDPNSLQLSLQQPGAFHLNPEQMAAFANHHEGIFLRATEVDEPPRKKRKARLGNPVPCGPETELLMPNNQSLPLNFVASNGLQNVMYSQQANPLESGVPNLAVSNDFVASAISAHELRQSISQLQDGIHQGAQGSSQLPFSSHIPNQFQGFPNTMQPTAQNMPAPEIVINPMTTAASMRQVTPLYYENPGFLGSEFQVLNSSVPAPGLGNIPSTSQIADPRYNNVHNPTNAEEKKDEIAPSLPKKAKLRKAADSQFRILYPMELQNRSPAEVRAMLYSNGGDVVSKVHTYWTHFQEYRDISERAGKLLREKTVKFERQKRMGPNIPPTEKKVIRAQRNRERSQALRRHQKRRLAELDKVGERLEIFNSAARSMINCLLDEPNSVTVLQKYGDKHNFSEGLIEYLKSDIRNKK